jgi:Lar family restriction alleviation protein
MTEPAPRLLLPCPHCGAEVRTYHDTSSDYQRNWRWTVECEACEEADHATEADAIAAWNRRAPAEQAAAPGEREAMQEACQAKLRVRLGGSWGGVVIDAELKADPQLAKEVKYHLDSGLAATEYVKELPEDRQCEVGDAFLAGVEWATEQPVPQEPPPAEPTRSEEADDGYYGDWRDNPGNYGE